LGADKPISLESFETFREHSWVRDLVPRYKKDAILAQYAVTRLLSDLHVVGKSYWEEYGRTAFTSLEGRVKTEVSLFRKLYRQARESTNRHGLTQGSLQRLYRGIKDLSGVRFSCPYLDEIRTTINDLVRPQLAQLGYATSLKAAPFRDKDLLDAGNEQGYRSYHFHIRVPTVVDIYGSSQLCLCEVQARSELQHVWALKSHDLFYKTEAGWQLSDPHVQEDMRQVSNSLRATDHLLVSIRDRVHRVGND
jgi:ppGpp synthetase/RelA/SpoT-type nucleotidyltranferase